MTCFAKFLAARLRSFGFALEGLVFALKTEANMRVHVLATVLVAALGLWLGVGRMEWVALLVAIGVVWAAELLNAAIEALCDAVSPAKNEAIKRVKDMAAAAVLVAAVMAAGVGALVFWPYLAALG